MTTQEKFLEQIDGQCGKAERAGVEAGLNNLPSEYFVKSVPAEVRRIAQSAGGPLVDTDLQAVRRQSLNDRIEDIEQRQTQRLERWRTPPPNQWNQFNWPRVVFTAIAGLAAGFALRAAGVPMDWDRWTLLGLCSALIAFGPWGVAASARKAAVDVGEGIAFFSDWLECIGARRQLAGLERALSVYEREQAEWRNLEQTGITCVTSRYELHRDRGRTVAERINTLKGA